MAQLFKDYNLGNQVSAGMVIYQDKLVPIEVYQALGLDNAPRPRLSKHSGYRNFHLLFFGGKDGENLQSWFKTAATCLYMYKVAKIYWV